jgi:D-galactarolactone isomerase
VTALHATGRPDFPADEGGPCFQVPVNACDCHHHIYDPVRFPYAPDDVRNQPPATVAAYQTLQKRLRLTRSVIVQPSAYGLDNRCVLDTLQRLGPQARGVVVLDPLVADEDLAQMHGMGVRGVRFNLATGASKDVQSIKSLSARVHALGWHVQFWMSAADAVRFAAMLNQLPNDVVFDHRGHLPQPEGINHPAYAVISKLIDKGKGWVKLSGLYTDSQVGGPGYKDTVAVGRAFVRMAPERMVWGTDWPHPSVFSARQPWPDDAHMLSLLEEQAPDESVRNRILVQNPQTLYGFEE